MRSYARSEIHHLKVALIHNTIAPYRHPLFEMLSQKTDLMVYYCSVKHCSRRWDLWPREYCYRYRILPRIPLKTPIGDQSLNLSIIKELVLNRPHVLILSDYVDLTTWLALTAARLLKIPLIYWTEGVKEPKSVLGLITRPLRTLFVKRSNSILVPGTLSRNYVISLGAGEEKVFIAPNAIDNELFTKMSKALGQSKDGLRGQLGFEDKVIILYVGQFIKRKGIEYLLYAYRKLKKEIGNISLLLVGSGPLEYHLKRLVNSIDVKDVLFISSGLSLGELVRVFSTADVFVLPTLEDIWGFVINESMVCGLPVVSTRNSQAAIEMVRSGENGYVVREADVEDLYGALKKIISSQELREKMGEKSREIVVEMFNVKCMAAGFMKAITYASAMESITPTHS